MTTFDDQLKDKKWFTDLMEQNKEMIKNKVHAKLDEENAKEDRNYYYWSEPEENND